MTVSVKQEQLDVLVEVGRRMQESAAAGDWETANHLQEKSQQLAGELFAEAITSANVQVVTAAVNEVLKINKCIMDRGIKARDGCLQELDQLQQSRRAVKEYTANTE
jgi:hypothetical protein